MCDPRAVAARVAAHTDRTRIEVLDPAGSRDADYSPPATTSIRAVGTYMGIKLYFE